MLAPGLLLDGAAPPAQEVGSPQVSTSPLLVKINLLLRNKSLPPAPSLITPTLVPAAGALARPSVNVPAVSFTVMTLPTSAVDRMLAVLSPSRSIQLVGVLPVTAARPDMLAPKPLSKPPETVVPERSSTPVVPRKLTVSLASTELSICRFDPALLLICSTTPLLTAPVSSSWPRTASTVPVPDTAPLTRPLPTTVPRLLNPLLVASRIDAPVMETMSVAATVTPPPPTLLVTVPPVRKTA